MYIAGRSKDVLIINGRNVYATDIERTCEMYFADFLRPGCSAAFQIGDDTAAVICEFKIGKESSIQKNDLLKLKADLEAEFFTRNQLYYGC